MQSEPLTPPSFSLRPVAPVDVTTAPAPDAQARLPHRIGGSAESGPQAEDEGRSDPDMSRHDDDAGPDALERPLTPERRLLCMIVRQLTQELLQAIGIDSDSGGRRRSAGHVRQVAMYVCHVAYSMPMGEVAQAFGRDRSTVGHACRMVEDRRDDAAYDGFVTIVERMASAVYLLAGRRP
jgi:hypothetical protein